MFDRRRAQPRLVTATQRTNISVVVALQNEEHGVLRLHSRLSAALDAMRRSWEVVYVDDGSRDGTLKLLRGLAAADPRVLAVELAGATGAQSALLAGLERSAGEIIVTMGSDLQDPPEEIGSLVTAIGNGHDLVAGRRDSAPGHILRRFATQAVNRMASKLVGSALSDWTCSLRAYRREVVVRMLRSRDTSAYVPALGATCARRIAEVPVRTAAQRPAIAGKHAAHRADPPRLMELSRELITGFTTAPLEMIPLIGFALAAAGGLLAVGLSTRWLAWAIPPAPAASLFAAGLIATGTVLVALGVVGEYVGRLHRQIMGFPRAVISRVHQAGASELVEE